MPRPSSKGGIIITQCNGGCSVRAWHSGNPAEGEGHAPGDGVVTNTRCPSPTVGCPPPSPLPPRLAPPIVGSAGFGVGVGVDDTYGRLLYCTVTRSFAAPLHSGRQHWERLRGQRRLSSAPACRRAGARWRIGIGPWRKDPVDQRSLLWRATWVVGRSGRIRIDLELGSRQGRGMGCRAWLVAWGVGIGQGGDGRGFTSSSHSRCLGGGHRRVSRLKGIFGAEIRIWFTHGRALGHFCGNYASRQPPIQFGFSGTSFLTTLGANPMTRTHAK